jgi:hypothetical protein
MKYHSEMTGGYYDSSINGTNMPDDALPISDADYAAIFNQGIGNSLPSTPTSVSPAQARLALLQAGKLDAVKAAAQAAGEEAAVAFEFATSFDRDSALLNAIAGPLELDLDALFAEAAKIKL